MLDFDTQREQFGSTPELPPTIPPIDFSPADASPPPDPTSEVVLVPPEGRDEPKPNSTQESTLEDIPPPPTDHSGGGSDKPPQGPDTPPPAAADEPPEEGDASTTGEGTEAPKAGTLLTAFPTSCSPLANRVTHQMRGWGLSQNKHRMFSNSCPEKRLSKLRLRS